MKRFTTTLIGFLSLGLATIGCGDLGFEFDFTHTTTEYQISTGELLKGDDPGQVSSTIPASELDFTGGWTEFTFDAGLEEVPEQINGLEVRGVRLYASDPVTGETRALDFVDRVEIYVLGDDSMPSFLVASYQIGDQGDLTHSLRVEVVQHVNLIDYINQGLTFYTFLQGSVPEARTNFHAEVDFRVFTRGY